MPFQLAQLNVAQLLAPLESPQLAGFVAALGDIFGFGQVYAAPGSAITAR